MAFRKLSECFLFNSINAPSRARIIAEMGNPEIVTGSALPDDLMEEHLNVISRRYRFTNVQEIVDLARKERVVVTAYEKTQIPPFIPSWLVYNTSRQVVAVVNAAPYTKIQKNIIDIDTKRLFGLLMIGMLNLKLYGSNVKIVNNVPVLTTLTKIYTRMVMKVLDRNYSVNLDKVKSDQISYLVAKFFLINVVGKTDNDTVKSIAANCCTKGVATQQQILSTEDNFSIRFENISVFYDTDLPSAFSILNEMTLRGVLESYCKMYGDFNFLSLEYFYNFVAFVMTSFTSSNFGNDALLQSVAGNELDSAFRLVNNIVRD